MLLLVVVYLIKSWCRFAMWLWSGFYVILRTNESFREYLFCEVPHFLKVSDAVGDFRGLVIYFVLQYCNILRFDCDCSLGYSDFIDFHIYSTSKSFGSMDERCFKIMERFELLRKNFLEIFKPSICHSYSGFAVQVFPLCCLQKLCIIDD